MVQRCAPTAPYDAELTIETTEMSPEEGKKKRGRKKKTDALNLLEQLEKYAEATLAFMHDFSGSFDNDLGERDIRMMKVLQKINVISAIQGVLTGSVPLYQIAAATAESSPCAP